MQERVIIERFFVESDNKYISGFEVVTITWLVFILKG